MTDLKVTSEATSPPQSTATATPDKPRIGLRHGVTSGESWRGAELRGRGLPLRRLGCLLLRPLQCLLLLGEILTEILYLWECY